MLVYTWQDFALDAQRLAGYIMCGPRAHTAIYAIPRGGLVLGVYLSHTLHLPLIIDEPPKVEDCLNVLVVDDNAVTGSSIAPFIKRGFTTAVLINNPVGNINSPTYVARTSLDWPVFPWEVDSGIALDDNEERPNVAHSIISDAAN